MKVCITGGGTGGHLAVAASLAKAAQKKELTTLYIGSTSGQDRRYFENSSLFEKSYFLDTQGVVNKKGLYKFKALYAIFKAFLQARKLLQEHRIDLLFSVGGFSAAPASFAALSLGIPLFIHEQNAKTGRLNALLQPFAKTFFSSYDPASPIRSYPVDDIFFQKRRIRENIKTVIFLGGSQGARFINNLALNIAKELNDKGIKIIHQAGERDYEWVKQRYAELGIDVDLVGFTTKLPDLMQRSDLAVSRSGASTLWELTAASLPALFIPYPYAAGDHQYYNAKHLIKNNLAWLARQEDDPKTLLLSILDDNLKEKSEKLASLTKPGAADSMMEYALTKMRHD